MFENNESEKKERLILYVLITCCLFIIGCIGYMAFANDISTGKTILSIVLCSPFVYFIYKLYKSL